MVYAASIRSCRPCPLREQCQWNGSATAKPRQVSVLLHPLQVGTAPLLWRDWSRRVHRRACMQLVRHQRIEVSLTSSPLRHPQTRSSPVRSGAHTLSWETRVSAIRAALRRIQSASTCSESLSSLLKGLASHTFEASLPFESKGSPLQTVAAPRTLPGSVFRGQLVLFQEHGGIGYGVSPSLGRTS